jgi:IS5 family transposase
MSKNRVSINWREYNKELINRGSVSIWFNVESAANWYAPFKKGKEGRPFKYSDGAIQMLCLLGIRFGLTLRSLQGFAQSILKLMGQDLEVPYYTTFSKRMGRLDVNLMEKAKRPGKIHLAIDSTGLKIFGEDEWKMRTHGKQKRRTWRKLHLGVDTKDNSILTAVLTTNDFKDSELFTDLLDQVEGVDSVFADSGYDSNSCFDHGKEEKIKTVIPPRKNGKISKRNSSEPRDVSLREIGAKGRKKWKKESGYHQRSLSETAMARVKGILGEKLRSRKFENQAFEAFTKIKILNKMRTPKVLN